jgi:hypothetical protein
MTTEDRLKVLRDKLFLACEDYDADESIRSMASAMTTLISGCTADRDAARAALAKLYAVMRGQIDAATRLAGAAKQ